MDFIAIDVETANSDRSSICQIGIVSFKNNVIKNSWQSLVNPEEYFDSYNVSIHGINEKRVNRSPIFSEIHGKISSKLNGNIIACHSSFDRDAISKVFKKYKLKEVDCMWLDTTMVVRRAWPEFSKRGYGLENVARKLRIRFKHHDAKEDARVAGEILVRAIKKTGLQASEWLDRVKRPMSP